MNERIKELWTQAEQRQVDDNGGVWVKTIFETRDKFAELIVQECIDIIAPYTVRMSRPGEEYLHPIQEIRKNFGVDE